MAVVVVAAAKKKHQQQKRCWLNNKNFNTASNCSRSDDGAAVVVAQSAIGKHLRCLCLFSYVFDEPVAAAAAVGATTVASAKVKRCGGST